VRGIVSGQLEQGIVLQYVRRSEDVRVGDHVVASGFDGIFPKGVPVGRVVRVSRKDRGLFLHAEIAPAADAGRLEEVLVAAPSGDGLRRPSPGAPSEAEGPPDPAALGILGPPAPAALRGTP